MRSFGMFFRKSYQRLVFVELGMSKVQLVVVEAGAQQNSLVYFAEQALSAPQYIAEWLQETVINALGAEKSTAYLVYLRNDEGLHEFLKLPQISGKQLQEVILWELPQYVSWEEGSYSYDFRAVAENKEEDYSLVELVAASKEAIAQVRELQKYIKWSFLGLTVSDSHIESHRLSYAPCTFSQEEQEDYNSNYASLLQQITNYYAKGMPLLVKEKRGLLYNSMLPRVSMGLALLLLAGCIGHTGQLFYESYKLDKQFRQLEQRLAAMDNWEKHYQEGMKLEKRLKELQSRTAAKETSQLCPDKLLPLITQSLAQDCWLDRFTLLGSRELLIQGKALRTESVQQLLWTMEKHGNLARLELKELQQLRNNMLGFTLITPQEAGNEKRRL